MPMILALIILLTMLLLTLMWSTIRKPGECHTGTQYKRKLAGERGSASQDDNEKLYRWLRYNGEKVIDEMTCELDALSAVRQTNRDSYRRQLLPLRLPVPDGVGRDGGRRRLYTGKGPQ